MVESITVNYVAYESVGFLNVFRLKVPRFSYFHTCWCHPTFWRSHAWLIIPKTLNISRQLFLDSDKFIVFFPKAYVALYSNFHFLFIASLSSLSAFGVVVSENHCCPLWHHSCRFSEVKDGFVSFVGRSLTAWRRRSSSAYIGGWILLYVRPLNWLFDGPQKQKKKCHVSMFHLGCILFAAQTLHTSFNFAFKAEWAECSV